MSKAKKATKKFNQKKAKETVQFKLKPHHKHGHKEAGKGPTGKGGTTARAAEDEQQQQQQPAAKRLGDMDLDEFLDGGFEAAAAAGSDSGSDDEQAGSGQMSDDADLDGVMSDEDDVMGQGQALGSDDGSADDGDADAAAAGPEAAAVAADNTRLKGAVSKHKQQLEALKEKDPEFYAFLQATDAELLDFGADEADAADSDLDDEEEEEEDSEDEGPRLQATAGKGKQGGKDKQKPVKGAAAAADSDDDVDEGSEGDEEEQQQQQQAPSGKQPLQVTSSLVDGWTKAALDKASLGAMMQLVKAYRAACHYGDTEQEMSATLSITSGAVFNKVLLFMLKEADGIFRRMLGLQQDTSTAAAGAAAAADGSSSGGKPSVLLAEQVKKAPRWRKVEPLVKSYLGNSIHLLSSMTQPAMTAFTLRRLRSSAAFLGPFPHLTKKLMRIGLKLYGSEEAGPRLQALLLVRQMSLVLPPPAGQNVLRGAYRSYVSSAKFVSPASLPTLTFMAAGFVELSSLDLSVTYQVGFMSIKELAVLLRNALTAKTQDAHKEVYCWQTLMCLELWVKVLAAAAPQGTLQPLVYPLTQLLLGAARLVPTPRYFPIRLRMARALNKLAQATGVYIPLAPLLLEMLQWAELRKTPTGTAAAPDLLMLLRLSKTQLKTSALQEEVISQVLELLAEHLAQWSTSVSYPELSHLPCVVLRGFTKTCAVERFRRQAKQLVNALERNAAYVGNARDNVSFAPQDLAAASAFLSSAKERAQAPLTQYATQLLQKAAARLAMRSSATQEVQLRQAGRAGGSSKRSREEAGDDSDDEAPGSSSEDEGADDAEGSDEDEEALGLAAKRLMRQKEKRLKRSTAAAAAAAAGGSSDGDDGDDAGAEDQVADYQLSEDESDEGPPAGGKVQRASRGGDSSGDDDDEEEEEDEATHQHQRQQQHQRQRGRGRGGAGAGRHKHQHKRERDNTKQQGRSGGHKQQRGSKPGNRGRKQQARRG